MDLNKKNFIKNIYKSFIVICIFLFIYFLQFISYFCNVISVFYRYFTHTQIDNVKNYFTSEETILLIVTQ